MEYNLKFDEAKIVEITPEYIGVLMDGSVHYNIGLSSKDTELDIKKTILFHACDDELGLPIVPFSRIDEIPKNIRESLNTTIDLKKLKEEISIIDNKKNLSTRIKCDDIRDEILPNINEFFQSIYEKEIKNNPKKYNELLERIQFAYTLFPPELGEDMSIQEYEEIINGL